MSFYAAADLFRDVIPSAGSDKMEQIINDALIPMMNEGMLSIERIHDLIYIKELIDRVSTRKYIESRTAEDLFRKYGVMPNIITWGDYFQTEMASSLLELADADFKRAVSTVKFDIISCLQIFSNKESDFFNWVDTSYYEITAEGREYFDEDEEEIIHLKILKDYFVDLGVIDNFTEAEIQWYGSFDEAVAM
jgi:hypothetical protein